MSDLHILCRVSAVTSTLSNLAKKEEEQLYLVIDSTKVSLANAELANYNAGDYVSSTTVEGKEGYTTDGIRLPEEAVTG